MRIYVRSSVLWKILRYGIILITALMLQTAVIPTIAPNAVIPDLVLAAVISAGIAEDEKTAGIFGLCAGFVADALGSVGISLSPVFYMLCGYASGVLIRFLMRRNFPSFTVYMAVACAARSVLTFIMIYLTSAGVPLNLAVADIIIPEYILTFVFSPLAYAAIVLPMARQNKQSLKN